MKRKVPDTLENIFKKMIGQVCWDIHHKRVNLSFNLGEPKLIFDSCQEDPKRDRQLRKLTGVQGQWFLWVYFAHWTLTAFDVSGKNRLKAITSSSEREKRKISSLLCGQKLIGVHVKRRTAETKLVFDLDAELVIRRPHCETKQLWLLYDIDEYCLSMNGDGTYDYKPSSGLDRRRAIEKASIENDITAGMTASGKE